MLRTTLALIASLAAGAALAAPVAKPVEYKIGDVEFHSTLVYDDATKTPRPGLVMAPNWYGANEASIEKAKTIAGKDYVILLADVYGKSLRPKNDDEAGAATKQMYADRSVLRTRIARALDALRASATSGAPFDGKHIGAIGFCFGGATVLDLARSGADIAGVVTFHGNLATDDPKLAKNIKGKVLSLNGADDSYVPAEQIAGFQKEMKDAGVDYQFVNLSGAVHCFAEPDQKNPPGCIYHERSAKRAFRYMHDFFDEVFAGP